MTCDWFINRILYTSQANINGKFLMKIIFDSFKMHIIIISLLQASLRLTYLQFFLFSNGLREGKDRGNKQQTVIFPQPSTPVGLACVLNYFCQGKFSLPPSMAEMEKRGLRKRLSWFSFELGSYCTVSSLYILESNAVFNTPADLQIECRIWQVFFVRTTRVKIVYWIFLSYTSDRCSLYSLNLNN